MNNKYFLIIFFLLIFTPALADDELFIPILGDDQLIIAPFFGDDEIQLIFSNVTPVAEAEEEEGPPGGEGQGPFCGDDVCDTLLGENRENCPEDCEGVYAFCGDDICDYAFGENNLNCPQDCYSGSRNVTNRTIREELIESRCKNPQTIVDVVMCWIYEHIWKPLVRFKNYLSNLVLGEDTNLIKEEVVEEKTEVDILCEEPKTWTDGIMCWIHKYIVKPLSKSTDHLDKTVYGERDERYESSEELDVDEKKIIELCEVTNTWTERFLCWMYRHIWKPLIRGIDYISNMFYGEK